jgi:uncharacterized membrane protein
VLRPVPAVGAEVVTQTSPSARARWTEAHIALWISTLLRAGVMISATVAIAGGIFYMLRHGAAPADYGTFRGAPAGLDSVAGVVRGVLALESAALVQLGILLLIATPILRVALSLLSFAYEGDRLYVLITAIVLGLLLFSLLGPGV